MSLMKEIRSKLRKIVLEVMPVVFRWVFSLRRIFSPKNRFGFLSEEFFDQSFMDKKLCDIGGFGMTSRVISEYYGHKQNRQFKATALFNRTLSGVDWRMDVGESSVLTIPDVTEIYAKNFLKYSLHANQNLDFLLSIDLYPGYEFSLNAMPNMPLMIWLRDPKGETELKKINSVECELRANKMSSWEEFKMFAQKEHDFFAKVYEQSKASRRPIVFVTNAHFLAPRAQRLYGLKEMTPYFLPNPIHYPAVEKIKKSERPVVCMLGRIDPVKRPWIGFELAKRFKNVEFLICGNSSYPEIMNPIIDKYKHLENLKFLGLVQGQQKIDILTSSWLLLNTSIHEGLPCSFLESFSSHTPILSSVNPDGLVSKFGIYTGDNLGDGMDEKTLGEFAGALEKMLSDKNALIAQGVAARKYIEKIYTFEMFEKGLQDIVNTQFRKNFER